MVFVHALMRWVFHYLGKIPQTVRSWIIAVCGIAALITPLLLWASMTVGLFKLAIGMWCLAIFIIYVMVWTSPDERI